MSELRDRILNADGQGGPEGTDSKEALVREALELVGAIERVAARLRIVLGDVPSATESGECGHPVSQRGNAAAFGADAPYCQACGEFL